MAVTYDDSFANGNRDRVRFHLADTTEDSGPRPSGGNFTDNELDALVTDNGTWQRAVGAALDRLAVEWSRHTNLTSGPMRQEYAKIAESYRAQAQQWKKEHGITAPCYAAGIIKTDGYSDDVTSDDVNTSSEYGIVWERVRVKD